MSISDLPEWYRGFFRPFTIAEPTATDFPSIALSIQPPWSHMFFYPGAGAKDVENRNWPYIPKYRGRFFVHASRRFDFEGYQTIKRLFPQIQIPDKDSFQRGGIIGMVRLVDVVSTHTSPWYANSSTALVVADAVALPYYPCVGKLNFWDASEAAAHYKRILQ